MILSPPRSKCSQSLHLWNWLLNNFLESPRRMWRLSSVSEQMQIIFLFELITWISLLWVVATLQRLHLPNENSNFNSIPWWIEIRTFLWKLSESVEGDLAAHPWGTLQSHTLNSHCWGNQANTRGNLYHEIIKLMMLNALCLKSPRKSTVIESSSQS